MKTRRDRKEERGRQRKTERHTEGGWRETDSEDRIHGLFDLGLGRGSPFLLVRPLH